MTDNGTGMDSPATNEPSGAVTSQNATRKNPKQGFKPSIMIDRNKHGIRRETVLNRGGMKRTGRKKV